MKIGRHSDYVSITATLDEMIEIGRAAHIRHYSQVACWARLLPASDVLEVYVGDGRRFRPNADQRLWTVALDASSCGAGRLEPFGMTPTTYEFGAGRKLLVKLPDVRAELRRSKPVLEKIAPFVPGSRSDLALSPRRRAPPETYYSPSSAVSDGELLTAKEIFNRAIERGFKPEFDGRGRILYFDQRVGQ